MSRKSEERRLQTRGVEWLKMALPELIVIAVINELPQAGQQTEDERQVNMIRMMLMKQMGLYPGAADLFLFKRGSAPGEMWVRALETKDKAPQSDNQKKFEKRWQDNGGIYAIWRSLADLYELCLSWGLKPVCAPPGWTPHTRKQMLQGMYFNVMMEAKEGD